MEQLYVFGTGNAAVARYYNTCFAIRDGQRYFMVDAGGGNGILRILEEMEVDLGQIHDIFITHEHTDHLLGIVLPPVLKMGPTRATWPYIAMKAWPPPLIRSAALPSKADCAN